MKGIGSVEVSVDMELDRFPDLLRDVLKVILRDLNMLVDDPKVDADTDVRGSSLRRKN
jgi:hypothetical protein